MRASTCVLAVALVVGLAAPARADQTATTGIHQFMMLEPGDASFKLFHGAIWLEHDKATWNYRWGGLQCKGRDLSDTTVQLLFAAFRSEYQVTVEYVPSTYKDKTYRCITGVTITKA
ncbi:MAG: hypothetical protein KF773_09815 [Deltaproteobacteria bacterium]|nr:hypothetical protein [Deltaproteobacteria bacterium]MCW5801607.1 hypothetical protein [Deltaproteobacteria bacterium]